MVANDDGGRVTLAVIAQKLDEISRRLAEIESCIKEQDRRTAALERSAERREEKLTGLRQDVDRLEGRDTFGSFLSSGLAVIAGLIGWFKQ